MPDTNTTFDDEEIRLDGRVYRDCTFNGCAIIYAGGPFTIVGCAFNDCTFHFDGPAGATIAFLRSLTSQVGGPELLQAILAPRPEPRPSSLN